MLLYNDMHMYLLFVALTMCVASRNCYPHQDSPGIDFVNEKGCQHSPIMRNKYWYYTGRSRNGANWTCPFRANAKSVTNELRSLISSANLCMRFPGVVFRICPTLWNRHDVESIGSTFPSIRISNVGAKAHTTNATTLKPINSTNDLQLSRISLDQLILPTWGYFVLCLMLHVVCFPRTHIVVSHHFSSVLAFNSLIKYIICDSASCVFQFQ